MKYVVINQSGLKEIQSFLSENHKNPDSVAGAVKLYAQEAEENWVDGESYPQFELAAHESASGVPAVCSISGFDLIEQDGE